MNAIGLYRVGNFCYKRKIPLIPQFMKCIAYAVFHCVIPYQCKIGKGTRFAYGGIGVILHTKCEIGKDCIIGANSVVTRSVPSKALVSGIPGRVIKEDIDIKEYSSHM